ncbi:MAG: hypothetical protein IIA61_05805 [Candidatus Marinimicrobia bacterium]|nr:hypothetical protein [Candidatus Neomarinimicrobiota bacterium]
MRTVGIFLALAGAAVVVIYIAYLVFQAIIDIPFPIKAGLGLIIIGGILFIVSLIRERRSDAKKNHSGG